MSLKLLYIFFVFMVINKPLILCLETLPVNHYVQMQSILSISCESVHHKKCYMYLYSLMCCQFQIFLFNYISIPLIVLILYYIYFFKHYVEFNGILKCNVCVYFFFSDLPFNTRLLIRNFFFNLKIMFVLKDSLLGLGFVLLLYLLRKVTICYVPLTQEKWSIATVRPILRETLPKSVRLPSVVATMTKTRQNVRINSMPTPCTRV